jgi:hypothetical protein
MHTVWKVKNVILVLGHKTLVGCGDSMHYSHMGMKKSNYKDILNMKYPCKGIKPLFMVVYLMPFLYPITTKWKEVELWKY